MNSGRRDFLLGTLATGALFAVNGVPSRVFGGEKTSVKVISLEQCIAMTPQQMAENSEMVMAAWRYIQDSAREIRNTEMRAIVLGLLENPAPTISQRDEKILLTELKRQKLVDGKIESIFPVRTNPAQSPQPFYSAPGSGWNSHHAYPGGLATHVAFNVASAEALCDNYEKIFDMELNRDTVLASQLLHDLHKPWVFQWKADGSCLPEAGIAGTGAHHVLSVAESMQRGLSPEVCIAQACAHDHPGTSASEASVVDWLKAASMICGKDAKVSGVLAEDGRTLPLPRGTEGFITHLADHDWVLSVPAAQWLTVELKKIAAERYGMKGGDLDGRPFNSFRNYILSQKSAMELYGTYSKRGVVWLADEVGSLVRA